MLLQSIASQSYTNNVPVDQWCFQDRIHPDEWYTKIYFMNGGVYGDFYSESWSTMLLISPKFTRCVIRQLCIKLANFAMEFKYNIANKIFSNLVQKCLVQFLSIKLLRWAVEIHDKPGWHRLKNLTVRYTADSKKSADLYRLGTFYGSTLCCNQYRLAFLLSHLRPLISSLA